MLREREQEGKSECGEKEGVGAEGAGKWAKKEHWRKKGTRGGVGKCKKKRGGGSRTEVKNKKWDRVREEDITKEPMLCGLKGL